MSAEAISFRSFCETRFLLAVMRHFVQDHGLPEREAEHQACLTLEIETHNARRSTLQ